MIIALTMTGVMAGLVPAISIGKTLRIRNRDARAKPAHDATMDCFAERVIGPRDFARCNDDIIPPSCPQSPMPDT
jgi:hypothetical protein